MAHRYGKLDHLKASTALNKATSVRAALLERFDLITEEQLALLLDVRMKTMKNKDQRDLPAFSKVGNKRLFFMEDVIKWLKQRSTH